MLAQENAHRSSLFVSTLAKQSPQLKLPHIPSDQSPQCNFAVLAALQDAKQLKSTQFIQSKPHWDTPVTSSLLLQKLRAKEREHIPQSYQRQKSEEYLTEEEDDSQAQEDMLMIEGISTQGEFRQELWYQGRWYQDYS